MTQTTTQRSRLSTGGRIDRSTTLQFAFNGRKLQGHPGDTLASALLANGVRIVGRSFKYHRPRGILTNGADEPNAIVQVGTGGRCLPNQRATQVELFDGLEAFAVNAWPSLEFDVLAVNGLFSRFLPAGFYYKTFMWPRGRWRFYEHWIRKAGGLGAAPTAPDPDRYEERHAHCDVLVIGGGPAGLAAALEAARRGARVVLVDDQSEFGGRLLGSRDAISGHPATDWVAETVAELRRLPDVRLLPRSTAFGYYDHNFIGIFERVTDHLSVPPKGLPRQRLWSIRAREVVIAAGAFERPLVFHNNDRPGVMLASAVSSYVNRYGVVPCTRAVVFTTNDSAYQTALDLLDAGVRVERVVDVRAKSGGVLPETARRRGVDVINGYAVIDVRGTNVVEAAEIARVDASGTQIGKSSRWIECDLIAMSGGWNPTIDMHCQSGAKAQYDAAQLCFVPGSSVQAERSAGTCNGARGLRDCLRQGLAAGAEAAWAAGFGDKAATVALPAATQTDDEPQVAMWRVPSSHLVGRGSKQFVDFQNDTSVGDIALAVRENFQSIEHIKRYTLLGFGTDQGKSSSVNGIGIVAQLLGTDPPSVGTTTFRPAYNPVALGALAGRNVGKLFDPVRKTPMHEWHAQAGAKFENVGQWKRAWYYPCPGETMEDAVRRECLATQRGVGILDYSTLGKIDVQGPDAGRFLNLMYTNDKVRLAPGKCNYGFLLSDDGMLLDDGVAARLGENHFYLTTTTGGAARAMGWLERWLQTEWPDLKVYLTSVTDHWANISLNGPKSRDVLAELCDDIDLSREAFPFMSFREGSVAGAPARIFRVSFSGELAFEINIPADRGRSVWEALVAAGRKHDITPYGTETLHVLRADKGYVIAGQDTDGSVTPVDLGMSWILAKNKEYLGKRSLSRSDLVRQDRKQLVGLLTEDPEEVLPEGGQIVAQPLASTPMPMLGHVTSSYFSARLGRSIALAVVKGGRNRIGETVYIPGLDGRAAKAKVTNPVFYDPDGSRQNV